MTSKPNLVAASGKRLCLSAYGVDVELLAGRHRGSDFTLLNYRGPGYFDGVHSHRHMHATEWFWMLEGKIECTVDGATRILTPGEFIEIPPNADHVWRNPAKEPFRMLIGFTDPEMDGYFIELFDLLKSAKTWPPADRNILVNLNARYKTEVSVMEKAA